MDDPFGFDNAPTGDDLAWRETYVVLFEAGDRPTLTQVEAAIGNAGPRLRMERLKADDDGLFKSVLVQAPDDNAALDIRFEAGEAVSDRAMALAKKLRDELDEDQMGRLVLADAWLEVMHFERVAASPDGDDAEPEDDLLGPGGLDPATLITVVEALAHLTGGLPIDPEAGEVLI
ncbi:hypothetical protein Pla108_05470 [Botrimarina colliarenosi]|uniref:Uncharacterized protein n=1 Tax=Botrimarina colliarenosi TaxID=2528001 RepID=A0A5C6AHY1_9BACT|nr:hypothetical protein [Botrimarina colliarenosi]TWT99604.1 hypothetical protein Pla108_05470 [Botrimarina colliarenosi]